MRKRGLTFKIPNEYGALIADIVEPVKCDNYNWHIDNDEIHLVIEDALTDNWLFNETVVKGKDFSRAITSNIYYTIFAELKAFPKNQPITIVSGYKDFINSDCQVIVLIYDCIYVDVYCKNETVIEKLFSNAENKGYKDIEYIDDNDPRTRMAVF